MSQTTWQLPLTLGARLVGALDARRGLAEVAGRVQARGVGARPLGPLARWALGLLLAALTGLAPLGRAQAGLNIWTSGGPEGGAVSALAIDPTTPGRLYAAGSGAFKSATGGSIWIPINTGLGTTPLLRALAIDPQTPATLYAGTLLGGVFKSTNGGANWAPMNIGLTSLAVVALAIDPQTPNTLYAGTSDGGVFKSTNGGTSWAPMNTGLTDDTLVLALAIDPQTPATLYAGTGGGGVFKSTNGAASWSPINTGLTNTLVLSGTAGTKLGEQESIDTGGLTNTLVLALALNPSGTCLHAGTAAGVFDLAAQVDSGCPSPPTLVAALLPVSRSVQVGTAATAFATIINAGTLAAVGCGIIPITHLPAASFFQTTDPLTNQLTGNPGAPVDIPPLLASQTYVLSLTPAAPVAPTDVQFSFRCTNTAPVDILVGVNTLLLSASATPVPDLVALALTQTQDGIVTLASAGAFAVATVNVGASGQITVAADTGTATLPLTLLICQTDAGANCLALPAPSVTTQINAGATPTFSIFAIGTGPIPFDAATNRIFVRFTDQGGVTRGATSVAVRAQ